MLDTYRMSINRIKDNLTVPEMQFVCRRNHIVCANLNGKNFQQAKIFAFCINSELFYVQIRVLWQLPSD
jgi:hypothetical protein